MNRFIICLLTCLSGGVQLTAQDLFDDTTTLQLTMVVDLEEVQRQRHDSAEYISAQIRYTTDGGSVSFKGKVRPRGNFRLRPQVCVFPPLKLRVKKNERKGTLFAKHKDLKIVTHCRDEAFIHQEYLIYELYQLLSPYYFRVRRAQITYIDREMRTPPEKHWAFLIEDDDRMAKRLHGTKAQDTTYSVSDLDPASTTLMYAFQYFIGNMDYMVEEGKNMDFILLPDHKPIPVPYDFDLSMIVNASYTGLTLAFDRRAMNPFCATEAEYQQVMDLFLAKREAIFAQVDANRMIDPTERARIKAFFRIFYRKMKKGKLMEDWLAACPDRE